MNRKYILLDSCNAVFSFLACRYLFMHYLYFQYYSRLVLTVSERDVVGPLLVILILSYSLFVLLSFFYREKVSRKKLVVLYTLYLVCLLYLLLFKNLGVRGLELNPFETIRDIQLGNFFVPLMNVLMFVPLGTLITSKKQFAFACLGVLGVELAQYVFHLGICDLGDVFLNILGLFLGIAAIRIGFLDFFLRKIG